MAPCSVDHLGVGAQEAAAHLANHLTDDLNEEIRQVDYCL
jgi:hypothetical protein